ncbi:MAG: HEAT repeat domain-containing protein [Polyangiaceae bacterium]
MLPARRFRDSSRRSRRRRAWWLVVVVVCMLPALAGAESVSSLAKKLLSDGDFRVRTQAALALGASGSGKAVSPLCKGLDDDSDPVRAAAAAALGRLAKGGKSCLSAREKREKDKNVRKMIAKALRLIDESAGGPTLSSKTKHYVALMSPKVHGKRQKELASVVDKAFRGRAGRSRGLVVAPAGESTNQAKKRLRKYPQVLGWALQPTVTIEYDHGQLVARLEMDILAYPERQSQGSLNQRAGMGGVKSEDGAKEDELVEKICEDAFDKFVDMADQVN